MELTMMAMASSTALTTIVLATLPAVAVELAQPTTTVQMLSQSEKEPLPTTTPMPFSMVRSTATVTWRQMYGSFTPQRPQARQPLQPVTQMEPSTIVFSSSTTVEPVRLQEQPA